VEEHERARAWFEERLAGVPRVGLPWHSLLAFLRIVTHRGIYTDPISVELAWELVSSWLEQPAVWVPLPTDRHAELLGALLKGETRSEVVSDAHLAALAIEHGLILCTTDRGFARFAGLRWENPLRAPQP
jgi:toxin-antitoxin system PIN domain toxin